MTKRRILNVTSKKKQDNMLPYVQNAQGTGQALGPITIPSSGVTSFIFSPTARNYDPIGDTTSTRNSQTIFARGFKEKISMRMSDGTAWRWRRIIFAAKGLAQSAVFPPYIQTSNGLARAITNLTGSEANNVLLTALFKGTYNLDWANVFTAKVDTQRVTLLHDRSRILASGNTSPRYHKHSQWYPLNKNIVYGDDENGAGEVQQFYSTVAKAGLGDVFVMDFFDCAEGATGRTLVFDPECTFYWHEK